MIDSKTKRRPIRLTDDLGPALQDNPIVKLLARYDVPISETRTLRFMAVDQDLDSKYKDYRVFLTGVRPNENLPRTGQSFENEQGDTVIDCWQIVIYWGEHRPCLEARWSVKQGDYNVAPAQCRLANLNQQVVKHLANALELLLWVRVRLQKAGRNRDTGDLDNVPLEEMITALAYLQADHEYRNMSAPTIYDLAAYYGKERTTLWRYFRNRDTGFIAVKKEAEKIAPSLTIEVVREKLKNLK
jgi:hypothetical protein